MPVQMNPNYFKPVDIGHAVTTGQKIEHNRLRNQALSDQQTDNKNMLKNRQKAHEIRSMYNDMPQQIKALEEASMFDQADELRNSYIAAKKNEVDLLTSMRKSINKDNYPRLRQDLLAAGAVTPEMMPVDYSDDWFKEQIDKNKGNLSKFTVDSFRNGANMSRDYVTQDGQVRWDLTGKWYEDGPKDNAGGGGAGGSGGVDFKATDSNAIGKQIVRLFGGFYDPQTGRISGLDPDTSSRVQAIQEEAELIYIQGGVPHGVAVAKAARKLGINIDNIRNKQDNDPLGLFNQQ